MADAGAGVGGGAVGVENARPSKPKVSTADFDLVRIFPVWINRPAAGACIVLLNP